MAQIGEFDPHLRPLVRLVLRGAFGREQTIEARLDTGFDLSLAVPDDVVSAMDLDFVRTRSLLLANGQKVYFSEYRARILWEGIERPIRVLAKPGVSLIGLALFSGYNVSLDVVDGGAIFCRELE